MTDEDKHKLWEAQQNLANAERAIDAAEIAVRAVLNGTAGYGYGQACRECGRPPAPED